MLLVLTSCADDRTAERLADRLVGACLAACVSQIGGIRSTYRWNGKIEQSTETMVLIKTTQERYPDVENMIRSESNYELPEIIAVPTEQGLTAYLDWISKSTQDANSADETT